MTVLELINMLQTPGTNVDAKVVAIDLYNEGTFPITGMIYNLHGDTVELTGENND